MGEEFRCPRTGRECASAELCAEANAPLFRAVPRIQQESNVSEDVARRYLELELTSQSTRRGVDFYTTFDDEGSATICTSDIIEDGLAERVGMKTAQLTLRGLSEACVTNTVRDLRDRKEGSQ